MTDSTGDFAMLQRHLRRFRFTAADDVLNWAIRVGRAVSSSGTVIAFTGIGRAHPFGKFVQEFIAFRPNCCDDRGAHPGRTALGTRGESDA